MEEMKRDGVSKDPQIRHYSESDAGMNQWGISLKKKYI